MTKKDYQAFARKIHDLKQAGPYHDVSFANVVHAMCQVFEADNPRFVRERFIEACETGTCKGMKG